MPFNIETFDAASVQFATKKIAVPELKDFFDEGEEPVWEIKSLTGLEIAIAEQHAANFGRFKAAMESIGGTSVKEIKKGFDELLGKDAGATPEQYLKWLKYLEFGSVPRCPEHICVKLAHAKAGTFRRLAYEISVLSAMGADLGK